MANTPTSAGHWTPAWVRKALGEDVKTYPSEPPTCWCGGEIGARDPGDKWGLGCLEDVNHDWTDVIGAVGLTVMLTKAGQNMGDHAQDVITFAEVIPNETVNQLARRLLRREYGDAYGRFEGQFEWHLRVQLNEPAPRRAVGSSLLRVETEGVDEL